MEGERVVAYVKRLTSVSSVAPVARRPEPQLDQERRFGIRAVLGGISDGHNWRSGKGGGPPRSQADYALLS